MAPPGWKRAYVLAAQAAGVEKSDGEGIADGQRDGGGGGGGEVEGAGLALDGGIENDVGVLGERGLQIAGEGDDAHAGALDDGQQVDQFVGFAGIGKGQDDVLGLQQAQVAMHGLGRMQHGRRVRRCW